MPYALNQQTCRKYLMAFTDGELNVEKNLQVLEQMAMDPSNARRVMHQQQLKKACALAMAPESLRCPQELRHRIETLARELPAPGSPLLSPTQPAPAAPETPRRRVVLTRLGRWTPAVAAALFLSGALTALYVGSVSPAPQMDVSQAGVTNFAAPPSYTAVPLSNDQIDEFSRRHVQCSRNLTPLDELPPEGPMQVFPLPGPMSQYLNQPFQAHAPVDLSALGYAFEKMGPCSLPGSDALHLIYLATPGSGRSDALSLWITEDSENRLDLQLEKLYIAADDRHPHPILLWRHANLTYYLVGDAMDQVRQAADMLAIAGR